MEITDILAQMGGLQSVAKELGVSENQAASGAAALLPVILGGFKKQTQSQPAGLEGLGGILEKPAARAPAGVRRGSPRCSIWTATAIRWTTSFGWWARDNVGSAARQGVRGGFHTRRKRGSTRSRTGK